MKNQYCQNCHIPLKKEQKYCGNCGQESLGNKYSFLVILKDFIGGLFNLDSKIWRTPISLFKPGFLTAEFFKGRRARYTKPGRLLLFVLLFYFALFTFLGSLDVEENTSQASDSMMNLKFAHYLKQNKDSLKNEMKNDFDTLLLNDVLDSLQNQLFGTGDNIIRLNNLKIDVKDVAVMNNQELIEKYEIEGYWRQKIFSQGLKLRDSPDGLKDFIIGNMTWVILLSIPVMGVCLLLLYIRRGHYYSEHILFLVHAISFFFILGIPFLILEYFYDLKILNVLLPLLWFVYLFLAMKKYYKQGMMKTFFKYSIFMFSYSISASILFVFFVLIGAFLF